MINMGTWKKRKAKRTAKSEVGRTMGQYEQDPAEGFIRVGLVHPAGFPISAEESVKKDAEVVLEEFPLIVGDYKKNELEKFGFANFLGRLEKGKYFLTSLEELQKSGLGILPDSPDGAAVSGYLRERWEVMAKDKIHPGGASKKSKAIHV